MSKQSDERPLLSRQALKSHVMPGTVPWELASYVYPLISCARAELEKQKGEFSDVSLTTMMVEIVQIYFRERYKRNGPSSTFALRAELLPLKESLEAVASQMANLSKEAKEALPWTGTLSKEAEMITQAITYVVGSNARRGRPEDKHVAQAVDLIAKIWEYALKQKMSKTLDKADGEYASFGPLFVQRVFAVLDSQVKLGSLDTAIMKRDVS